MEDAADVVSEIELVRSQLDALARVIDDAAIKKALVTNSTRSSSRSSRIPLTCGSPAPARWGGAASKLLSKIGYRASSLANADFKPTDQHLEVQKLLEERLTTYQSQLDGLRTRDLAAFNELLHPPHHHKCRGGDRSAGRSEERDLEAREIVCRSGSLV